VSSTGDATSALREALHLFRAAFEANPNHARVVNYLSDHFFLRAVATGDQQALEKAETLATRGYSNADQESVRAESLYYLARCYHNQRDYETYAIARSLVGSLSLSPSC